MYLKKASSKNGWSMIKLSIPILPLLIALLLMPQPGNTREKTSNNNRLPPAPDTGSPEEDFSAGGTRDSQPRDRLCGIDKSQVVYLLGNRNREFTSSAYPTFWFYFPGNLNRIAKMNFVVKELESGQEIYTRYIKGNQISQITGIKLPEAKKHALSPEVNYAWDLKVDCNRKDQESEIALSGWITRKLFPSDLSEQLATTSEAEKHLVYLKHNLLYDALTQLVQRRIAKPNNVQVETAWNQLLTELGWQDLIKREPIIEPSTLNIHIGRKNSKLLSQEKKGN